jgi:hypothetical protein
MKLQELGRMERSAADRGPLVTSSFSEAGDILCRPPDHVPRTTVFWNSGLGLELFWRLSPSWCWCVCTVLMQSDDVHRSIGGSVPWRAFRCGNQDVMVAHKESAAGGYGSKAYGIDDILRDSHRYSEEIRQRDREDQRRGWLWFSLLVFTVGSIVGFWAWISQ